MRAPAPLALALACSLAGCLPKVPRDPATTCHIVAESRAQLQRGVPLRDLVDLSLGTPAQPRAYSAWQQQVLAWTFGAIGAGALAAGLVLGFTGDQSANDLHNTGYGLIGGTVGIFAVTIGLGFSIKATAERARAELIDYGSKCRERLP
jgi:hypothetical protein